MDYEKMCPFRRRKTSYAEGEAVGGFPEQLTTFNDFEDCMGSECMAYWEDEWNKPHCAFIKR